MHFSKIAGTTIALLAASSDARDIYSNKYNKVRRAHSSPRLHRREVPQEHSHEKILSAVRTILNKNNPAGIVDPVFALLGNAAAANGLGKIADPDCLQQAVADQAFTNAKAEGDVNGMVIALQFRALERNSGSVGATSAACTSIQAVNPEIAAIEQHQDPASNGAAALNKQIVLDLAVEIASVGGDPQLALETGTFAPGTIGDPTARGNSCDDANDATGCIFTQNLLVADATADEIDAAVAAACGDDADDTSTSDSSISSSPAATTSAAPDTTSSAVVATATAATSTSNLSFGTCSPPAIEGGLGFDGRKEFSFQPVNKDDYNHGSAQNIGIIADFNCDTLINRCGLTEADEGTKACRAGQAAVGDAKDDGALADKFNSFIGVTTNFAIVAGSASAPADTTQANVDPASLTFGSCSAPSIEGGLGFDGRKEFSFQPVNKNDYAHGSAQNIGIITQFNCDTLINKCGLSEADAGTKACRAGQAAIGSGKDDGSLADKFNAFIGVTTNFKDATGSTTAAASTASGDASASAISFGSCSNPAIVFGRNADRPNEDAFVAANQNDFSHGSALGIGVISSFICQQLNDKCKASAAALTACAAGQVAAGSATGQAAADAFNAALGL